MTEDEQSARSIRYASLIAIALLPSGKWAVYQTVGLGQDQFRNTISLYESFPAAELQTIAVAERGQRALEDELYEERRVRLIGGEPESTVATQNLEEMGL